MKLNKIIFDGSNFFEIEKDNVRFWGLDIESKIIQLDKRLQKLINKYKMPINETVEINDLDEDIYKFSFEVYCKKTLA